MKEEALKLAEYIEANGYKEQADLVRRLVEELDKQKYQNELLENSIKFAMLANNLQDKQGEPVVYWDGKHFASKEKSSLADIPLYTTPQIKPLSDEEIKDIYEMIWDGDLTMEEIDNSEVRFARAILERYGIK